MSKYNSEFSAGKKIGVYLLTAALAFPGCASAPKTENSPSLEDFVKQGKLKEKQKAENEFEELKKTLEEYKEKDSAEYKELQQSVESAKAKAENYRLEDFTTAKPVDRPTFLGKLARTVVNHPFITGGIIIGLGIAGYGIHVNTKGDAKDFVAPEPAKAEPPKPPKPPDPGPPPKRRGG